jgi:hypothetical protein
MEKGEASLPALMLEEMQHREASEEGNAFPLALKQEDMEQIEGRPPHQDPADVAQRDNCLRQRHSPTDAADQPTDAADEESADVAQRAFTFEQRARVIVAQGRSVYTDTYPDTYPDTSPDTCRSLNLSQLKAELSRAGVELQAVRQHTYADVC